jgi:hypothetical protein
LAFRLGDPLNPGDLIRVHRTEKADELTDDRCPLVHCSTRGIPDVYPYNLVEQVCHGPGCNKPFCKPLLVQGSIYIHRHKTLAFPYHILLSTRIVTRCPIAALPHKNVEGYRLGGASNDFVKPRYDVRQ